MSILTLAIRLISIFELIHSAGYVYNDLKPENILVGFKDKIPPFHPDHDCFAKCTIYLMDFGLVSRF